MPISTIIDSPAALYALMTTTSTADLSQNYIQTANIDMTTYPQSSQSIAGSDTPTPYDFTGIYDGQGYTITIGDVTDYTGLFDTVAPRPGVPLSGIIKNVNVIYNNAISVTLNTSISNNSWGGLVANIVVGTISNCYVTFNAAVSIRTSYSTPIGLLCGFMGQNSSMSNSSVFINNEIYLYSSTTNVPIGLMCGQCNDSDIIGCSIIAPSSRTYSITLSSGTNSYLGLICGLFGANILSVPIRRSRLLNNVVNINQRGAIAMRSGNPSDIVYKAAICGSIIGDSTPGTTYQTIVSNCAININNGATLIGDFGDLFGQIVANPTITNCQFLFRTVTSTLSRPITINPTPPRNTPVIYINNYSNTYDIGTGNYYIPNAAGSLVIGPQSISLASQTSPAGMVINGNLYLVGTTYSSSNNVFSYTISVNGVGSMYFGFISTLNQANSDTECVCQINSCSTNPQTGITADSRITNIVQDKTIRANVDTEFATQSVVYPKFKSYRDYANYLQGALKY